MIQDQVGVFLALIQLRTSLFSDGLSKIQYSISKMNSFLTTCCICTHPYTEVMKLDPKHATIQRVSPAFQWAQNSSASQLAIWLTWIAESSTPCSLPTVTKCRRFAKFSFREKHFFSRVRNRISRGRHGDPIVLLGQQCSCRSSTLRASMPRGH